MKTWTGLAALAAFATCTAVAAAPPPAPLPIAALSELPMFVEPALSPDGRKIVTRINQGGQQRLAIYELAKGPEQPPVEIDGGGGARWFRWAGNDRILIGSGVYLFFGGLTLPLLSVSSYDVTAAKTSRLEIGKGLIADDVIYTDPAGRFVLLCTHDGLGDAPSVWRVDLATGKSVEIQKKKADIWRWFVDDSGAVFGGVSYRNGGFQIYARDPATGALRKSVTSTIEPGRESVIDSIHAVPGSDTGLIVTNEPTGRFGVYAYDLRADAIGKAVFEHPEVDVIALQTSASNEVEGVFYEDDRPRVAWLKPELKHLQAQLDRTFPGKTNRVVSMSSDRNIVLISTSSADDPGAYYVFDRKARRMNAFAAPYEALLEKSFAEVKPVRYRARDGLSIPGYLTLPPDRAAKGLPLIVMPHGGPFARTSFTFDPLVQFLATRGYAVLQPNFRGSTGFGRDFVEKGYGETGKAMQDDLDDGVDWLARDGVIDPKRVCMVGGSYGGYAALWAGIRNPERYRCVASLAGVSDLRAMLKHNGKFLLADRYSKEFRRKIEGEQKRDLAAVSPLQQEARLAVPALIAHGDRDPTVPVDQSRKLVTALKARGAAVQAAFYPLGGHGFERSEDLRDFMQRLEAFLEIHNPAETEAPGAREATLVAGAIGPSDLISASGKKPKKQTLALRYLVTADGRVTSCQVTDSSGSTAVDKLACATAEQQLQYRPQVASGGERQEAWLTQTVQLTPTTR
jgi:TonB family protein